jgi:ribosomal protein S14
MKKRLYLNTKESLYRSIAFKISLKKKLLKSIAISWNANSKSKNIILIKRRSFSKFNCISKQNTRCLYNGRPRGVITKFGFSRHMFKLMAKSERISGFKTKS